MQEIAHPLAHDGYCPASWALQHRRLCNKRQKGAVAILFAGCLIVIIGFIGLALDLARIYNRKAEMQGMAKTVAIAAAKKLNGTPSGISDALAAANGLLADEYYGPKYEYTHPMVWSNAAMKFSKSADGSTGWLSDSEASASPGDLMYVQVDTNELNSDYGNINMLFMPVLGTSLTTINVGHTAIAGRRRIAVTPLAICAMAPLKPTAKRSNLPGNDELIEYGFRRGVSYDLMNLNPNGTTKVSFLVDPIAPPSGSSSPSNFDVATVGPYVCTGTVALPKVSGATVNVQTGNNFPIDLLFNHLNSRFELSNGKCDPDAAPPDTNIKQYTAATISWMPTKPVFQTAKTDTTGGIIRQTIADLPVPNNQTPTQYGPLWAYARAVQWSPSEPANGYVPFAATTAIWASLYSTGPGISSYSAGATATPYFGTGTSPSHRGIQNRRVLNIPLLACPVTGSVATVLAIGKFFMTIPGDAASVSAEFAGATTNDPRDGLVELYQ